MITRNAQPASDKLAIGLSLLCAVHCLALPVLLVLLPSLASLQLDNEAFHGWMATVVVPVSLYALTLGCKKHKRYRLLALGLMGLVCLISAVILGEHRIGEVGEKLLTLFGATLIAWGHVINYRLCRSHEHCDCPEHQAK